MVTATRAQPQAAGPAAASTVERGACPGNRSLVPTFRIPFAGWTLVTAGSLPMPRGSKVLGPHRIRAAGGSISYRVLASHSDSCCHKIVTIHGPVVKAPGRPWALLGAGVWPISKTPL